jgi:hypothetical protein
VPSHEEELYRVLQKVGQAALPNEDQFARAPDEAPSVTDAEDDDRPSYATTGDPAPINMPDTVGPTKMVGLPEGYYAPITHKNLWVHHDTHPIVLDISLLKRYDTDWFTWEAETLWKEIMEDFHVPSISDQTKTKIQSVKTLHINEWFWTKWEVFCWITQGVNNNIPDFQVLQKPSIPQLINAVDIATMVRDGEEFTAELQMFVAASVLEEGVLYAPEPIAFCQDEIVQLLDQQNPDAKDLIAEVDKRWKELSARPQEEWENDLEENPVDVQVAKLVVAQNYLSLRRRQLKEQLRLLK